jgi:hypothetical protein
LQGIIPLPIVHIDLSLIALQNKPLFSLTLLTHTPIIAVEREEKREELHKTFASCFGYLEQDE